MKTKEKRKRKSIKKENLNSAMKLLRRRAFSFLKCFHKEQLERERDFGDDDRKPYSEFSNVGDQRLELKLEFGKSKQLHFGTKVLHGSKAPEKFTNGFSFGNGTSLNPNFLLLNLCPPWKFFIP